MVEFSARRISMAPAEIQPNKIGRKGERKKSDGAGVEGGAGVGEGNEKAKEDGEERRKGKMTRPFLCNISTWQKGRNKTYFEGG